MMAYDYSDICMCYWQKKSLHIVIFELFLVRVAFIDTIKTAALKWDVSFD